MHAWSYTGKLLLNARSQINAGSLIDAGGSDARVLLNAGSQINAGDAELSEYDSSDLQFRCSLGHW